MSVGLVADLERQARMEAVTVDYCLAPSTPTRPRRTTP
jgi:hypothetical protein